VPGPSDWQSDPAVEIGNTYAAASIREAVASDYRHRAYAENPSQTDHPDPPKVPRSGMAKIYASCRVVDTPTPDVCRSLQLGRLVKDRVSIVI
jgi:hypothetical protein